MRSAAGPHPLPELADTELGQRVTVHHLLSRTSGLVSGIGGPLPRRRRRLRTGLARPAEIGGIAWAVANRCRAWGGKTVDQLLTADPNYTYAVKDGNIRYGQFMAASAATIEGNLGMKLAQEAAENALAQRGADPSCGGYWWDGKDFKTNYKNHPKVKDGFRFGDPSHNIFGVKDIPPCGCPRRRMGPPFSGLIPRTTSPRQVGRHIGETKDEMAGSSVFGHGDHRHRCMRQR